MIKKIVLILIISSVCVFADDFIIGAYGVDSIGFFSNAHDSLGLNTIINGWIHTQTQAMDILSEAEDETLKVILANAPPPQGTSPGRLLNWYCNLWHHFLESEEEGTYFEHDEGKAVEDLSASNDSAWVCSLGVDTEGWLQKGKWNSQFKIATDNWWGPVEYTACFQLKRDTTSLHDTTRVCSLRVYGYKSDTLFKDSIITIGDFQEPNVYQAFDLKFTKAHGSVNYIWYDIWWYENVSLWADYVEVKDCYVDSLVPPLEAYYDRLTDIAQLYSPFSCQYKSLYRFYLRDEPRYGHFPANAYVMEFLEEGANYQYGIQALGGKGQQLFQSYADSVKPQELMFDYYPMRGAGYHGGRTPEDSGSLFQERLDELCMQLSDMRGVALSETLDFLFIAQAFGKYDSVTAITPDSGGNEGDWRLPTQRELRCITWLSLVHGAKGIMYYRYRTRITHEADTAEWMRGLWRHDGTPREPLYSEVSNINETLDSIGSILITLESDTVFLASNGVPPDCFIKKVRIWNYADTLIQIGTFHKANNPDDKYFIIVNRHCLPSESLEVVVELEDTLRYLYDCYNKEIITYELIIGGPITYGYRIKLQPGQGRLFRMVPFSREFKINQNQTYTNMPYVALRTKATSSLGVDSMKIWQYYGDTLIDSTGWIPYDTTYFWYLYQDEGANTVYIQYKVDGSIKTPVYSDSILFDKTLPIGSFVINDDSTFTNIYTVTLNNSMKDSSSSMSDTSGMSQMRFGNKFLENFVKNSGFDSTGNWAYDTAIYHDSLNLFEIPIQTTGNYFYQSIAPESLADYNNDTMLLWIDLVDSAFTGTGKVEFLYIYGHPRENDSIDPRGQYPFGTSITISQGTNARVSHYNLFSYFKYHPDPQGGDILYEARVRVFIDAEDTNAGTLFIDNFRLDVVSPFDSSRFENYDSLKEWTLIPGNGVRKVYGQFADGAGNETGVLCDSIIVDTTKPARKISSPQNGQTVSGTIAITGFAYDYADPEQHFKQYELKYREYEGADTAWYWVRPDSLSTTPKNPTLPPATLGQWNTQEVTDNHGNGWYCLRLTVRDLASNYNDTTINVYVQNKISLKGEFSGFSHDVYGLAAQDEIYIGEIGTGKIYRYNTNYQLIDTFNLIDSVGIDFPLAMAIDNSGKLWASNITSHFINRFTPQGNLLLQFGSGFSLPSGIGFDNSGNTWVSDRMHNKIKKFDASGNQLFQFGTKGREYGEIKRPIGIALLDNKIYIADSRNNRISVFDTLGDFIRVIGESAGLLMPFGLTVDSTGCLFVSDFIGDRVIEFGPSGNQLLEIDSILDAPSGLALSSDANILYVSDTKHKRVLAFTVRGEPQGGGGPQSYSNVYINRFMFDVYPSIFSEQLNIRLQGMGESSKNMEIKIYDVSGRLVKQFNYLTDQPFNQIIWRGQDDLDRQVSSGVYFIRLVIDAVGEIEDYKKTKKAILLK